MNKRTYTNEEKIEFYKAKIQKLEEAQKLLKPHEIDFMLIEIRDLLVEVKRLVTKKN